MSKDVTLYLSKIKNIFNIKLNNQEIQRLIRYNTFKINAIEKIKFLQRVNKKNKTQISYY